MRDEKAFCLNNGGYYAISPDEAFTVIEKFSYALGIFAFLSVVGIFDDKLYLATFFKTKRLKE